MTVEVNYYYVVNTNNQLLPFSPFSAYSASVFLSFFFFLSVSLLALALVRSWVETLLLLRQQSVQARRELKAAVAHGKAVAEGRADGGDDGSVSSASSSDASKKRRKSKRHSLVAEDGNPLRRSSSKGSFDAPYSHWGSSSSSSSAAAAAPGGSSPSGSGDGEAAAEGD